MDVRVIDFAEQSTTTRRPKKRLKTLRACDQCRKLHVRCEEPFQQQQLGGWHVNELELELEEISRQRRRMTRCGRCLRMDIDCTFFLPIDETRPRRGVRDSSATSGGDEKTNKHSPKDGASTAATPRKPDDEYLELFTSWTSTYSPIVTPSSLSSSHGHTKSTILLKSVIRLTLSRLFVSPSLTPDSTALESFIRDYFLLHDPTTATSTTHTTATIQSLLLLSLITPDPIRAGNHFTTALRMACASHWHLATSPLAAERPETADYIWHTLVALDAWLYLLSGVPPLVNYMSFNLPMPESPPQFFTAITSLSELLRIIIRPRSTHTNIEAGVDYNQLLADWESRYPAIASVSAGDTFNAETFTLLLYATTASVLSLHVSPPPHLQSQRRGLAASALRLQLANPTIFKSLPALAQAVRICTLALLALRKGGEEAELLREWRAAVGGEVFDGVSVLSAMAAAERGGGGQGKEGRGWEVALLVPKG